MNALNDAFFFVTEKLIEIRGYFMGVAWGFGRTIFLIALLSAALNYALTGEGLKENIIKLFKATVFFIIIMGAYPRIINWITSWTYNAAMGAVGNKVVGVVNTRINKIYARIEELRSEQENYVNTFSTTVVNNSQATAGAAYQELARTSTSLAALKAANTSSNYFGPLVQSRSGGGSSYTVVVPAAALQALLLVAGECIRAAEQEPPKEGLIPMPNIGLVISCYVCAFFVMLTGSFAVLEYIMAFLEFIFITSVGIMLFPMSMWEGSKFLTEKLISAIIGFSIKLLFCTICIFLLMWGMLSLANGYVDRAFKGLADQILLIIFTSLLFYYICKSAPGLAQSLLTGSPSLSAAGAIGAAKAAAGAVAGVAGLAAKGGGMIAQGGMNLAGGMAKMAGAGKQAAANGGGVGGVLGAMAKSAGGSLLNTAGSAGGSLTRSLLGHSPLMPKGGGAGGYNRNSPAQMFMQANRDGSQKSAGDFFKQQFDRGANPNEYKVAASDGRYQPPQSAAPASAGAAAAATKATTTSHVSSVGSGISAHKTARLSHHRARNRQNPKG